MWVGWGRNNNLQHSPGVGGWGKKGPVPDGAQAWPKATHAPLTPSPARHCPAGCPRLAGGCTAPPGGGPGGQAGPGCGRKVPQVACDYTVATEQLLELT